MKDTERNWQVSMEVGMGEKKVDFFFNMGCVCLEVSRNRSLFNEICTKG